MTETALIKQIGGGDAWQKQTRGDWPKESGCVVGLLECVLGLSNIGQMVIRETRPICMRKDVRWSVFNVVLHVK